MRRRGGFFSQFKALDAYAKPVDKELTVQTKSGALITLISSIIMIYLVFSDFMEYKKVEMKQDITVQDNMSQRLPINLDISFPNAPCVLLDLDVTDALGEYHSAVYYGIDRIRIDKNGTEIGKDKTELNVNTKSTISSMGEGYCGSCYEGVKPQSGCCNTCEDVHQAYLRKELPFADPESFEQCRRDEYVKKVKSQDGEGCRLKGHIAVNNVYGSLSIVAGEPIMLNTRHVHAIYNYMPKEYDFSHTIHYLSFGPRYSEQTNPLNGKTMIAESKKEGYQYFAKIVPSEIRFLSGFVFKSNEYSVTEHVSGTPEELAEHGRRLSGMPGFKLTYDISPLKITRTQTRNSIASFLTSICAVVGGIFSASAIIDALVHKSKSAVFKKKQELGKLD